MIVFTKEEMAKMSAAVRASDRVDRIIGTMVRCTVCGAAAKEPCTGEGMSDSNHPAAVHVARLKLAIPRPRPAKYWWLTAHEEFLAGQEVVDPRIRLDSDPEPS